MQAVGALVPKEFALGEEATEGFYVAISRPHNGGYDEDADSVFDTDALAADTSWRRLCIV